ncbi:uncharacterized protein A4U43_C10F18960 [Asparagus officinalis]|uniref:CCT domain-containing protein n=1 Tax=Asparagus officinalis TaxID=4686 RepID=A0A5P1E4D9_ASPOF|nr:uncharacterized protein LOC109824978 [Asparagus officinalis]ONK57329.1 uncharacterized protein A4U43_C10F18960 [Asparagus officinalis]
MEGISTPIGSQILDFHDNDEDINLFADGPPACPITTTIIPNSSSSITGTTAASCDSEDLCCFLGDDASFDFDPATISSLLDCDLDNDPPAVHQLPTTSSVSNNVGGQNQDQMNQLLLTETMNRRNRPLDSPDSVILPDMSSWAPIQDSRPINMMPSLMGYMGMDNLPSCAFLDTSIVNRYQQMNGGDGPMGFFHRRTMMGVDGGIGAEGIYGLESAQGVYNSLDMQVIGDYKNLVDGCDSNHTTLPTSDITPLDDSTLKVGRLSPEERKEKIHRYLKKRSERNFKKKIKYACRKTLADSRPRVRGRFAKNDEHGEATTRPSFSNHEYFDEEEVVMVKEEDDMLNSTNIFLHMNGVNSFNYNYTIESWI